MANVPPPDLCSLSILVRVCVLPSLNNIFVTLFLQAGINIWDFEEGSRLNTLVLHKVTVQALAFSPNEKFLVSLGGRDDGK